MPHNLYRITYSGYTPKNIAFFVQNIMKILIKLTFGARNPFKIFFFQLKNLITNILSLYTLGKALTYGYSDV